MKTIVFLYVASKSKYQFEKSFNSQSAFDLSLSWASKIENNSEIAVLTDKSEETAVNNAVSDFKKNGTFANVTVASEEWTTSKMLHFLATKTESVKADFVVYSFGNCPFLDIDLTREVVSSHIKYLSEYTFADGYPYGFAPEVIASGALNIISSLADGIQKSEGDKEVSKTSIFSVMKGDINSFEIETVIAPKDWRLLRLDFSCSTKSNYIACKELYEIAKKTNAPFTSQPLSEIAEKSAEVQQTVPAFYNIQISSSCKGTCKYCPYPKEYKNKYGFLPNNIPGNENKAMGLEQFKSIVSQISALSENAVVGLSAWGEALEAPDFEKYIEEVLKYEGLSVLIETDGTLVTTELASKISSIGKSNKISWIISIDAFTEKKYNTMHGFEENSMEKSNYSKAVDSISILEEYFAGNVYPQFLRVNENEDELEGFYRFYHEKSNASKGNLIIQKYDSFCGLLKDEKPADLSPLERNTCWHIKRDMTILQDGSVPLCREHLLEGTIGNVLTEGLESVWKKFRPFVKAQIEKKYENKCGGCDEYYTFNF